MTHPLQQAIVKYEELKQSLAGELRAAGGNPDLILRDQSWITVLSALIANNITAEFRHVGGSHENF